MSKKSLIPQGSIKLLSGLILMVLLLFWPAGTWSFPNSWRFIALLFVPMFFVGLFLLMKDPELLEKRLKSKETEQDHKVVDTGLYRIVRHPMYFATLVLLTAMPLGSVSWLLFCP